LRRRAVPHHPQHSESPGTARLFLLSHKLLPSKIGSASALQNSGALVFCELGIHFASYETQTTPTSQSHLQPRI